MDAGDGSRPLAEPVALEQRIGLLDALRGFALLGILPMNIPTFALSYYAYMYPPLSGEFPGPDQWAWAVGQVFFDMKMMTLFAMLFGAGVVLLCSRLERRGFLSAPVFFRRTAWLALFGMLHAYLIWYGDILFAYALCGLLVFSMRRLRPAALIVIALVLMTIPSLLNLGIGISATELRRAAHLPNATAGAVEAWESFRASFYPSPEQIAAEITAQRSGFNDYLTLNAPRAASMQTLLFMIWGVWRITGVMLLGAALLKLGVLDGRASTRRYAWLCAIGLGLGAPMCVAAAAVAIHDHFDVGLHFLRSGQLNYWGSVPLALGYVGVIGLATRVSALASLLRALADVGRLALTNYLAQSIICLTLFGAWGCGLWERVSRTDLWLYVGAIWTAQIAFSVLWLRWFRFGPFEWLWRTLTYMSPQPMSRAA